MSSTARIAEGIGAVLNGIGLDPRPTSVSARKRPVLQDGEVGSLPLIFICVGDEEEMECLGVSMSPNRMTWLIRRPVAIALAFAKQGKAADNDDLRNWRDAIWSVCTLDSMQRRVPELNDVNPRGKAIFDPAAFNSTQADWSLIELTVETLEHRNL